MTNPLDLDATDLIAAIAAKRLSAAELMAATLERVDAINPRFNALVALRAPDALLAEARERDAEFARSGPRGPLHGLPFAVKDLANVKGLPTSMGSPFLKDFMPEADSVFVERLRSAGAIFIGKTNTPEFGLGSQTYNPVFGATRNAYDPSRTSGGSSGGAAVALAHRLLPLADGSDYGGSLRNPAGWNGVYGFRPSFGVVPNDGREPFLPSMGVSGPMARTIEDLALLLSVMAGPDRREPLAPAFDPKALAEKLAVSVKGRRLAWLGDWNGALPCQAGVIEACAKALEIFEALGCVVEPAVPDFPLGDLWRAFVTLRHWQAGTSLLPFYRDPIKRQLMKPEAIWEVEEGAKLSAYDVSAASAARTAWHQALLRFFERFDAFLLPTAQVFPFPVETHWPREIAGRAMSTYHEWMTCVVPATMSGGPAVGAPAGFGPEGLPIGVQIVCPPQRDRACLELAFAYDQATQWARRHRPKAPTGAPGLTAM